jgi:hypothetical protein
LLPLALGDAYWRRPGVLAVRKIIIRLRPGTAPEAQVRKSAATPKSIEKGGEAHELGVVENSYL